jgi:hypothetical protein
MQGQLVAARYPGGRVVKGWTSDFRPNRAEFHVRIPGEAEAVEIRLVELKALFFIKNLEGSREHEERKEFDQLGSDWSKIWVQFKCDREELAGWSAPHLSSGSGFFFLPTDMESNIDKIFVPHCAVRCCLKGADAEVAARRHARLRAEQKTPTTSQNVDGRLKSGF